MVITPNPQVTVEQATKQSAKYKIFFPNLDGIRFFCFLGVFLLHSFVLEGATSQQQQSTYSFLRYYFVGPGHMGVNFFFVLSGFLITFLLIKEKEFRSNIHVGNFYIRRILRIWPLYFFNVIFGFFIFPKLKEMFGEVPNETADIRYYLVFLGNFDTILKGQTPDSSMLSVLWSVCVEEQFYLIWPLLLFIVPAKRYRELLTTIIVASVLFRIVTFVQGTVSDIHTLTCISDMAIGGLGATLIIQSKKFASAVANLSKKAITGLYVFALLMYIFHKSISSMTEGFDRYIMAAIFAMIILEQCYAKYSFFKLGRYSFISNTGKYTYGLYCLHMIAILITAVLLKKVGLYSSVWALTFVQLPISFALSYAIAWISFHFFEKKILNYKDRFAVITKN